MLDAVGELSSTGHVRTARTHALTRASLTVLAVGLLVHFGYIGTTPGIICGAILIVSTFILTSLTVRKQSVLYPVIQTAAAAFCISGAILATSGLTRPFLFTVIIIVTALDLASLRTQKDSLNDVEN